MQKIENKKQKISVLFICCLVWTVFAHGYRFANNLYSHDALLDVVQNDSAWEIALGRFVHPVLLMLRGGVTGSWLICILSFIWTFGAIYLVYDLLQIHSVAAIISGSGILICNMIVTDMNSGFLPWVDFYALSLFLSVLGVWLIQKGGILKILLGIASFVTALGIYQAYICVAITLILLLLVQELLHKSEWSKIFKQALFWLLWLIVSAVVYYAAWYVCRQIFHIWAADTYNGMSSLGDYAGNSILGLIGLTYKNVFISFWNVDVFVTMNFHGVELSLFWVWLVRLIHITLACIVIYGIVKLNIQLKTCWWHRALEGLLFLILPFGMNVVCFISKGMEHALMTYAFLLFYVMLWMFVEKIENKLAWPCMLYVMAAMLVVVWVNAVFANQVYVKKSLQEDNSKAMVNRIVMRIEEMEDYIPGETPVAFYGTFEASDYVKEIEGLEGLIAYGMGKSAMTYRGTDYAMVNYALNVPMNQIRVEDTTGRIADMPCYPAKDSIQYVDGVLVVKLSDE